MRIIWQAFILMVLFSFNACNFNPECNDKIPIYFQLPVEYNLTQPVINLDDTIKLNIEIGNQIENLATNEMIDLTQFQFNLELKIKQYFTGSSGDFQITNGQNNFIVLVLEGENFTPINSSDIPQNFVNYKLIYKTYFISKVSLRNCI